MKTKQVIDHIVHWLDDYLEKSGLNGFTIGISGGIDSAVTSTLVAKTGRPTLVLEIPIHQESEQVSRAQEHIGFLKAYFSQVDALRVDLSPVFDVFFQCVQVADKQDPKTALALANMRSRLRMSTLYYYAGLYDYLVTGTGNKVEDFGVGFFTKYGDGGVDLSPIADLTKSQVRHLAKTLGISALIRQANPTDGLWEDNRSDEDQLGASYKDLEWAMEMAEQNRPPDAFDGGHRELIEKYLKLHRAAQHKIRPIPVCKIPSSLK
ncbi:MAG: NAD(+) synthase [Flavobacteriales bacterium AspAUS03]